MNPISPTAATQAASILATVASNPIHWALALALGAALSSWGHALVSKVIDSSKNPLVHFFGPALIGMVGATLAGYFGQTLGVTPGDAALAWATFTGFLPTLKALGLSPGVLSGAGAVEKAASSPQGLAILVTLADAMGEPEVGAVLAALASARNVAPSGTDAVTAQVAQAAAVAPQAAQAPQGAPQVAPAIDPRP